MLNVHIVNTNAAMHNDTYLARISTRTFQALERDMVTSIKLALERRTRK